jgi:arylsulfatase A-like enzyme
VRRTAPWIALVVALACGPAGPPGSPRPISLVIVTLDTTRADALGAYGQEPSVTPRIDSMAATGLLFEHVVASVPSTLPSHVSLFTGQQPFVHGVRSNSQRVSPSSETLPEILAREGWRTAAFVAAPVLGGATGLDEGFALYSDPQASRSVVQALVDLTRGRGRITRDAEEVTGAAIDFLRENGERPFFLWLHYFDPHQPLDPPERFRQGIPDPYLAEVRRVDHHVGLVLDEIESSGLRDRTLVVLTADHGEGRGEHGEGTHSWFVYDSTMRVPLVLWGAPLVPRGARVASLVRLVDVAPTVLDLLGLPPLATAQGTSLAALLEDPSADLGLAGYGESIELAAAFGDDVLRFVREGRWKYVHKRSPELFDVVADPGELHDRSAERPEVARRLRALLESLLADAPEPPADTAAALGEEELAALVALGYAAGPVPEGREGGERLDASGPDATTRTDDIRRLERAWGQLLEGQLRAAELGFRSLSEHNPQSAAILSGWIEASLRLGDDAGVIPLLRRAIELDPASVGRRVQLGTKLRATGDARGAEALWREALELEPCSAGARLALSDLLRAEGRQRERLELLAGGDDACRDSVKIRNALAWALATVPDAALRDGARALALARAAVAETDGRHPDYLDTLAAAYAETGRFEQAVAAQRRALAILEGFEVPPEIRADYESHLASLESGRPVREP